MLAEHKAVKCTAKKGRQYWILWKKVEEKSKSTQWNKLSKIWLLIKHNDTI